MFVKGSGFLSFAENLCKNIGKYICKNLGGKHIQKRLYYTKRSTTEAIKTVKEVQIIHHRIIHRLTHKRKKNL